MKICLIGDSILDNFNYIDNPICDITHQLSKLMNDYKIFNYAVDGSKIKNVYDGAVPSEESVLNRDLFFGGMCPYHTEYSGKVKPLKLLKKNPPDFIVCSVGKDEGEKHKSKFIWGSKTFLDAVFKDGFKDEYVHLMHLLSKIKNSQMMKTNVIIILPPLPHESIFEHFRKTTGWGLQFVPIENMFNFWQKLEEVYKEFRKIYISLAKKHKFAIIDLFRTLDSKDETHYSHVPQELSNKSGKCLAKLIQYVIKKHNFHEKTKIYFAPNCGTKIQVEEN
jgi:hypothetical protein